MQMSYFCASMCLFLNLFVTQVKPELMVIVHIYMHRCTYRLYTSIYISNDLGKNRVSRLILEKITEL